MSVGAIEAAGVSARRARRPDPVADLVARCKKGDAAAFRALFDRHADGVYRHMCLLVGPGGDIDDLVQMVFMNVYQSIGRFRGRSAFSTWLFRITINVARQEIRQRTRRRRLDAAAQEASRARAPSSADNPESQLLTWQEIHEILDDLSAKKRETYVLYVYEGYSLEEIANLVGSSVSTIGSRLQAARREILAILGRRRER